MRHEVLALIILTTNVSMPALSAPPPFTYDYVEKAGQAFSLPSGYFRSELLEATPISSRHLDLYDKQDAENHMTINNANLAVLDHSRTYPPAPVSDEYLTLKTVPKHPFSEDIFRVSQEYNIDPLLLHAIAEVESHFNAKAVSHAGAQGLMQIMPDTARRFGMTNPEHELFNPISNLRISSNYIRALHKIFGNNIPLILAAYNAGENAVIKYGYKIPPYRETKNYVKKVMKRYLELKGESYHL